MPVTAVRKDPENLTLTVTASFEAPVERIWQLWADPRQLERWWGPPTHPATVVDHELAPGGTVSYFMTSPEGERFPGWWRVKETDPPHLLRFEDGFGDSADPAPGMPVSTVTVTLTEAGGRTEMQMLSRYPTRAALEQVLAMGMEEGVTLAINQIDDLLGAAAS